MAKPRWSELVAAFGLDTMPSEPGQGGEQADSRSDKPSTWAPASLEPDEDPAAVDRDADASGDGGAEAPTGLDQDDDDDFKEATAHGPVAVAEAAPDADPLEVPPEDFGALLLAGTTDLPEITRRRDIKGASGAEGDRFAELGSQVAHAMRVAYDAVGEMKRLEQRIADILATQDSLRATLVDAANDLHRSLAELSLGDG